MNQFAFSYYQRSIQVLDVCQHIKLAVKFNPLMLEM